MIFLGKGKMKVVAFYIVSKEPSVLNLTLVISLQSVVVAVKKNAKCTLGTLNLGA